MDKNRADMLISQYQNKIFGFAMEKMRNISQAEELAADIVCEVYRAFLNASDIVNTDGYVYRTASNVFARYLHHLKTGSRYEDISEISIPFSDENFSRIEDEDTIQLLRKEISYLSERQRAVICMYYYDGFSVGKIADKLGISSGTVKWHLSDARSVLKEELSMEKFNDDLAVNPIKFTSMGHNGYTGSKGDTADMFDTRLKQNIAFACYHTPLTVKEIAKKIGVPVVYVSDELNVLEENGYIDRIDKTQNPKYRTNMYISDLRLFDNTEEKMYREAAVFFCDRLYGQIFKDFDNSSDNWGFTCLENDKNYMKYNLVMLCTNLLYEYQNHIEYERYAVARPDGGRFIAHACADDFYSGNESNSYNPYWYCGFMNACVDGKYGKNNDGSLMQKISLDCRFSDRSSLKWRDDLQSDWESLYKFIKSGEKIESLDAEEYKRLCDKCYLVNGRVSLMSLETDIDSKYEALQKLIRDKAVLPDEIMEYCKAFDGRIMEYLLDKYPPHIQPIVRLYATSSLSNDGEFIPYLIERMLEIGMLSPLTDLQKKTVFTVIAYEK